MHPTDQHRLRLFFNNNKNSRKPTYTFKLNNALLKDNLVKEEIKRLKTLEFDENEGTSYPNLWDTMTRNASRKTHSSEFLPKETGESIH